MPVDRLQGDDSEQPTVGVERLMTVLRRLFESSHLHFPRVEGHVALRRLAELILYRIKHQGTGSLRRVVADNNPTIDGFGCGCQTETGSANSELGRQN
jgi:hypothetical protein